MENTIRSLKQELIDTIAKIDKGKLSIYDLKTVSETVGVISTIKDDKTDYWDMLLMMLPFCSGLKFPIMDQVKGDE